MAEPTKLSEFSDEWLDDVARAIASAAGEGVYSSADLVSAVADEYKTRQRRVPGPYGQGDYNPDRWPNMLVF